MILISCTVYTSGFYYFGIFGIWKYISVYYLLFPLNRNFGLIILRFGLPFYARHGGYYNGPLVILSAGRLILVRLFGP